MIHTIQNDYLILSVQQKGAELCRLYYKESGIEFMWNADPGVWASHAPVLFPIVGGLKNGSYEFEGKFYQMPKHGIIRRNDEVTLLEQSPQKLSFQLKANEASKQLYPFDFEFIIHFELDGKKVLLRHEVINHGANTMWFSLGGHPAFSVPLIEKEAYEDYFLEFDELETARTWYLDANGLIAGEGKKILDQSNQIMLTHDLFANDALIFKSLKSKAVNLCSRKSGALLRMEYPAWPYLGVWAKPNGDFVCIEPWMGIADAQDASGKLEDKEGIMKLGVDEHFEAVYTIELLK